MRWVLVTLIVLMFGACCGTDTAARSPTLPESPPSQSTTTTVAPQITVTAVLEAPGEILFGSVNGRVLDAEGVFVTRFSIPSGWERPGDFDPDDLHQHYNAYEPTGAPKAAQVELPAPGTYTFKILEFTVSAGPCGT
ncbi:MAG: hypothetical protein GY708_19000, partial [Actinomycetia bacterium]|nr:hypothetical protein [Actinomycetes bacterium]